MRLNIKKLLADKFIRGTFILTAVTFLSSALNYLVHPLLTRHLTIPEYGDYQALLAFLTFLSILGAVINTSFTKEFSVLSASAPAEIKSLRRHTSKRLFYAGLLIFIFVMIFSGIINRLFKISQPVTLIITALGLTYAFPLVVNRALLTGRQYFSALSFNNLLDAFSRLLLIVILVVFQPWGLIGASFALGLSGFFPFVFSLWQVKKVGLPSETKNFSGSFKKIWRYGFLVLWFTSLTQFFYNFDMLLVKSFFSPEEAGLYGALLTIGRIIFFVGGSIPLVMFPVLASLAGDDNLRRYKVLGKSLALMSCLVAPVYFLIAFFPEFVIKLVVGSKYLGIAQYLPDFSLAMLLLTVLTVLSQYFLAMAKRRGLVVLTLAALSEAFLLALFHDNFFEIILVLDLVFGLASLILVVFLVFEIKSIREFRLGERMVFCNSLWKELSGKIREFYPYLLGFYLLSLLVSLISQNWQDFFYWPAFNWVIAVFTFLFLLTLKLNIRANFKKYVEYAIVRAFLFIKNRVDSVSRYYWIRIAIISIIMLLAAIFMQISILNFIILLYALTSIIFIIDSRYALGAALFFLTACFVLLIFKNNVLAEKAAVYVYYLLIITILVQVRELKM